MSFIEALKRLLLSNGQNGPSRGTHASEGSGPSSETAVAMIPCEEASA